MEELLEKLNSLSRVQTSMYWEENVPEDIWNQYFTKHKVLAEGLDIDKHRWYERSIVVIEIPQGIIGINLVTNMYSESSDIDDIMADLYFFEMEAIPTVTYRKK